MVPKDGYSHLPHAKPAVVKIVCYNNLQDAPDTHFFGNLISIPLVSGKAVSS